MKILRLTTLLDFGGQEKQFISFTEAKSVLNNEYVFAAIGHGGFAADTIKKNGFRVEIFNQNPAVSNLKNIWLLYKWFKKEKPDVVHTAAAEANFHGVIAAKLAGVPHIVAEEIGFPNHSSKAKFLFRFIYTLTDKVVCVSHAVKNFLVSINEIGFSKGVVIYNPVSAPKKVEVIKDENFTIVSVGRLEKVKNQELLINAFSKLNASNVRLILVGDGREREHLEAQIKHLGIVDKVTLTGFTPEPEKYLAKADLFVLSSLSEGFGIAAVEAMLLGIPCLCSNVGGLPEIIDDGKTGWLFNPKSDEELTEKLGAIISSKEEEIIQIGRNGYAKVATAFTIEAYAKQLENFYSSLND